MNWCMVEARRWEEEASRKKRRELTKESFFSSIVLGLVE